MISFPACAPDVFLLFAGFGVLLAACNGALLFGRVTLLGSAQPMARGTCIVACSCRQALLAPTFRMLFGLCLVILWAWAAAESWPLHGTLPSEIAFLSLLFIAIIILGTETMLDSCDIE